MAGKSRLTGLFDPGKKPRLAGVFSEEKPGSKLTGLFSEDPSSGLRDAPPGALSAPPRQAGAPGGFAASRDEQYVSPDAKSTVALPTKGLQKAINVTQTASSVANAFLNQVVREQAAEGRRKGKPQGVEVFSPAESLAILKRAAAKTDWGGTLKKSASGASATFWNPLSIAKKEKLAGYEKLHPAVVAAGDLLAGLGADTVTGSLQGRVVGAAAKGLGRAAKATGAEAKVTQAVPYLRNRKAYRAAKDVMSLEGAKAERISRAAAAIAEDLRKTSQRYLKTGSPIKVKDSATGRTINLLDELVADYVELGAEGSKFSAPQQAAQQAARIGVKMDDVARIGDQYKQLGEKTGKEMVDLGLLDASSYQKLKGQYLPRLYLLHASDAAGAERYLRNLEKQGVIGAEAARFVRDRISKKGARGTGFDPNKKREILEYSERFDPAMARAAEGAATPAMTRYASAASREIGEARGLNAIAANPELAIPAKTGAATAPKDWLPYKIGNEEYLLHPGARKYLDFRESADLVPKIIETYMGRGPAKAYQGLNRAMRRIWISSPKTAVNNAVGNYSLGSSAAAINGVKYTLPGYGAAVRQVRAFRKSGNLTPILDEALNKTDLLAEGQSIIPRAAKGVGGGFGVEGPLEKLRAAPGKLFEGYSNAAYRDVEQAGRLYLYQQLREGGKSIDEAARIVRAAMIDYTDVGPAMRFLEQNNILPFLTFPSKAIFQYVNTAARRPDKFNTYIGERFRNFIDGLADEMAIEQGKESQARAARARGDLRLTEVPIPGKRDAMGQRYIRTSLFGPMLQMAPQGGAVSDLSAPLTERIEGAFPLGRAIYGQAANKNLFIDKPIVTPGAQPPDVWGDVKARTMHAGKAFIPELTDAERIYRAGQGTVQYPSRFAPHQSVGEAVLQGLTGITSREGIGDSALAGKVRAGMRADDPKNQPFADVSNELARGLYSGEVKLDERHVQMLAGETNALKLKQWLDAAKRRLPEIINTDYYTGEEKKRAVRNTHLWLEAIAARYNELIGAQEQVLAP